MALYSLYIRTESSGLVQGPISSPAYPRPEDTKVALMAHPEGGDDDTVGAPRANPRAIPAAAARIGLILRSLLFAVTAGSVAVMVTSKQTKEISLLSLPPVVFTAKFNYSPAFIYFIAATSTASLYSLISALGCIIFLRKPAKASRMLFCLAFFDALIFGVVTSAVGAGASIGYVGAKGNSHVGWPQICNMFDKFCRHVGASLLLCAVASILILLLTMLSAYSLYLRTH